MNFKPVPSLADCDEQEWKIKRIAYTRYNPTSHIHNQQPHTLPSTFSPPFHIFGVVEEVNTDPVKTEEYCDEQLSGLFIY